MMKQADRIPSNAFLYFVLGFWYSQLVAHVRHIRKKEAFTADELFWMQGHMCIAFRSDNRKPVIL